MNLEGVEKTMLLTLFAKAQHSQQKNHKFYDQKAIEVISKIDYDFTLAKKDRKMNMGVIGRTFFFSATSVFTVSAFSSPASLLSEDLIGAASPRMMQSIQQQPQTYHLYSSYFSMK